MPARTVPPPPRPEPVTLDQIYDQLTRTDTGMDAKAYHLVALNTVAFNPSVKLFFYEHYQQRARAVAASSSSAHGADVDRTAPVAQTILDADRARREALLKSIAFFLAQRLHPVSMECRWETVSLLGEFCRMENVHKSAPTTPQGQLEAKLNAYAKLNLEYLACQLPWFLPAVKAIMGAEAATEALRTGAAHKDASEKKTTAAAEGEGKEEARGAKGSSYGDDSDTRQAGGRHGDGGAAGSREAIRDRLRARRQHARDGATGAAANGEGGDEFMKDHEDEDALIALGDILRALPMPTDSTANEPCWTPSRLEQAHDLMFLDASTTMLHLIPNVSRSLSHVCAQCGKTSTDSKSTSTSTAAVASATATSGSTAASTPAFLRCSSCKAVYYCCAACQREHWSTAHRNPCRAYKEKVDLTLAEYDAMNSRDGKGKGKKSAKNETDAGVTLLEVPLEPALFYETRRYLFDHRDASFGTVDFNDYFMRYTVRGT